MRSKVDWLWSHLAMSFESNVQARYLWYTPVIPTISSLRQEDSHEFKYSLAHIVTPCL